MRKRKPVLLNGEALMVDGKVLEFDAVDQEELDRKIDAPQTAAVGEVLTVEEIGEDGKPKKWKTAPGVNITTELTQESTDAQVPSAKAAYDAIQNATDKDAVKFVEQELTEDQKQQARENILAFGFTQLCDDSIEGWHDSADSKYTQALGLTNYDFPLYVRYVQSYGSSVTEYALTTIRGKMCFVIRYLSSGKIQETSLWYSSMTINNITQKDDGTYNFKWTLDQILSHLQEGKYVCAKFNGYILPVIKVTDSAVYYAGVDSDNNLVTATQSNSEQTVRIKPHNFIVTLFHDQKNNQYSVDKNFSEVLSACKDGSTVVVNFNNVIIPIAEFGDSRISFTISLPGFATFLVFLKKGDNDVCNITFNGFPHYEFSALYVNFSDGESEGLLDSNCAYDSLMEQTVFERNVYGYYQSRELTLTKYPSPEDGDLAYFSFTGVNPVDDKVYFERIDYKQDGTITYQKKEVCTDIDVMTGATSTEGGSSGLVPAPAQADSLVSKFLNDRGVWEEPFPLYSWYNLSLLSNTGTNLPRSIIITQSYNNPVSGVPEDRFGLLVFTTTNREYLQYIMFGSSGKIYDVEYNRGTERYYYYESKYSLPAVTTSDNGKILQVANGTWAKTDLPASLPSPTTAQVGQIVKVKAVDADGKITETETVNIPTIPQPFGENKMIATEQIGENEFGYTLRPIPTINDFIDLGITSAQVGQIIKVKAVDDFGNPHEWEAVDMSTIVSVTYDEETGNLQIGG